MVSITLLQLASILVASFLCFPFILFLFPFFTCWLGILHLKEPGTFFFQFCKAVVNITYSCLENGDFANLLFKLLMGSFLSMFQFPRRTEQFVVHNFNFIRKRTQF